MQNILQCCIMVGGDFAVAGNSNIYLSEESILKTQSP